MDKKPSIFNLPLSGLEAWVATRREPLYRAKQVLQWLYQKRITRFREMSDLSERLRDELDREFLLEPLACVRKTGSGDTTQKFLFALRDQSFIESVLIPASPALYGSPSDRKTLCVSTQVGCAYGCKFCASGLEGWTRNLEPGEMVEQILRVEALSGEKINNIVFMGMGEPLANYQNLLQAIEIIRAPWGIGIGARHITISTSGLAPRIRELADQPLQIRLAVSLHGATDAVREKIMPINRKFNLAALMDACAYYGEKKHQRITFEYILIENVNDGLDQVMELAGLARRLEAKINLIPYNTVEGLSWKRPSQTRQQTFYRALRKSGVDATIRREKGHDIDAACGQLRLQTMQDKNFAGSNNLR
ncbi:MAG TPA: 23S rRNA (adenine(2503)-C(2))-methyltransferase RlmN [Chthoniobacterales bacterium]|jgi:23S rRNA (adenine2503-C2)-methyltransferase|nr:23S rRNA (adenine(2503)-C(2))-methyltransferase RlmN [Chthoniobacterales bacterium]